MAKKTNQVYESHEGGLSVVLINLTGDGETIRQGLSTLERALANFGGQQVITTRQINGGKQRAPAALPAAPQEIEGEIADSAADYDTVDADEADVQGVKRVKVPATPRKFDFISDISKNASVSLKDFAAERKPTEGNDKYLVACLWLQTEAGYATFTADHVWTCFQMLEWKKLADFTQPMRLMKSKKNYFDMLKKGDWQLNPHGLEVAQGIKATAV